MNKYNLGDVVVDKNTKEQYMITDISDCTVKLEKVGVNHIKLIGVKLFETRFYKL